MYIAGNHDIFLSGISCFALHIHLTKGESPSADGDKGRCPLTPAAFFEKIAAPKKLFYLLRYLLL